MAKTIRVVGIPEAIASLKRYQKKKRKDIQRELKRGAIEVRDLAVDMVAVKTGRLKGSLQIDDSDIHLLVMRVGTNVFYGVYVEFGTRKMAARPFLFPAFFAKEGEIIRRIGNVLKKDIRPT
jgi:HK97 gp10 family phage protein